MGLIDFRRFRQSLVFATAALVLAGVTDSRAQIQSADQRACIVAMNVSASTVAAEQRGQVYRCVVAAHRGLLAPGTSVLDCVGNLGGRLSDAIQRAHDEETRRCLEEPDFGYSRADDLVDAVLDQELNLAEAILGSEMNDSILPAVANPAGAKCQAAVAKDYRRLASEQLKAFIACTSSRLSSGQADSVEGLQECFAAIDTDAKGKIRKAFLKMARSVVSRCPGADFPALFPGTCGEAPDFITCAAEKVSCHTCVALNAVDGTSEVCDLRDDGEINRSCVDPNANECEGENGGDDCDANATCTDEYLGFQCACNEGYHGDGVECTDDDECADEGSGNNCDANATCTNTPGSFECACNAGFDGDGLTCTDFNECAGEGGGNNCSANATCSNIPGSFACSCNPGYGGDGVTCGDFDECAGQGGGNNCSVNGSCLNSIGSFSCSCNAGYSGNGVTCTDLDECAGEGGGDNCSADGFCTNTPGGFNCTCNDGYSGNGVACTDLNECLGEGDGNECDANATCDNTPGGYGCTCNAGYAGDGYTCTDQDECFGEGSGNNCSVNAECTNEPGSFNCTCRDGYFGDPYAGECDPIQVNLTSPVHGSFTTASSVTVTGNVVANPIGDVTLKINGNSVVLQPNGNFTATVAMTPEIIFNGIRAEVTQTSTGYTVRDRRVVIWGQSVNVGSQMSQSVGLRITDTGFNALEPVLTGGIDIDVSTLVPPGTVISDDCDGGFLETCNEAYVKSASSGALGIDIDSQTNYVDGIVKVNTVRVDLDVYTTILGIRTKCDSFYITMTRVDISGDYTLSPDAVLPSNIDVNLSGASDVATIGFQRHVACGGTGFQTAIIEAFGGDTQAQVENGLKDFLKDPDGAGAQDAPIAQAIEDALGAIELAGPIGLAFGVNLSTPLFSVPEDVNGVTLGSHSTMTPITTDPSAPQFTRTLVVPSTFPQSQLAQATSPGGLGYGLGIAINDTAFNQILAAQVMAGLLQAEITEIPLVVGQPPAPLTAGLLSIFIPEFAQLDGELPLRIKIVPTLAPALTGNVGQNGEIAEMIISHLLIQVVSGPANNESIWGVIAADMLTSFDMVIEPGTGNLSPLLGTPAVEDISVTLLTNPLGASEATIAGVIPTLLIPVVPSLSSLLGSFPLPNFLGLAPSPVEITRVGGFMGVYMNVTTAP